MAIDATELRPGAHTLRFFAGEVVGGNYDLVLTLDPIDAENVNIVGALGDMSPEFNIELGLFVINLGYRWLHFEADKSVTTKVTRWASLKSEDEVYRYYMVDLGSAKKKHDGDK